MRLTNIYRDRSSSSVRGFVAVLIGSLLLAACGAATSKAPTGPGVTSTTITLGATGPLTGSGALTGLPVAAGENAYFKYINSHGGVKGRKIKFIYLDDQYDPATALQKMHLLVQSDHIFAVAGGEGTPNFLATVPYLKSVGIPAIAPYAPSNTLGTMATPNIYMVLPNYIQEFKVLARYAYAHSHAASYSLVGITGNLDENALQGMREGLAGTGATVHNVSEVPGTSNMAPLAAQLLAYNAKWVFTLLTDTDTGNLLEATNRVGYHPQLASWSGMTENVFYQQYGSVSQGNIAVEEILPATSHAPGVQQMVKQYKAVTGTLPNSFNELGWVQGELAVAALKAAKSLTWSAVEQALNGIHNFKSGVLPPISFGARNRQGSQELALAQIHGNGLVQLSGFTSS